LPARPGASLREEYVSTIGCSTQAGSDPTLGRFVSDKHLSLFVLFVSDEEKSLLIFFLPSNGQDLLTFLQLFFQPEKVGVF
jgi:hypothetical protein